MKINIRLLLLTFAIVVLVTVSSSLIYYSLTNSIITREQNQNILNAASDFIFSFEITVDNLEENYKRIITENDRLQTRRLNEEYIDFIFTLENDRHIDFGNFISTNKLNIKSKNLTMAQFLADNPNIILKYDIREENTYYFGKVLTEELINTIADKIRAKVALIVNESPWEVNEPEENQKYFSAVIEGVENLRFKNQYDLYNENYGEYDFFATYYRPKDLVTRDLNLGFLIFSTPKDVAEFRYTSGLIAAIIILVGIALSIILVFIFTTNLRDQISKLSYAAEVTGKGNLNYRVPLDAKNELGKLAQAFNNMLDELKVQKEAEKEYTEFITLLNQKPSLKEISEAAIKKIINSTGISFGVLYLVEENSELRKIASYGITDGVNEQEKNFDYYKNAIEQKDVIEFKYRKNLPVVRSGISEIRIKYIVILPIIYSDEVVAVIELAAEEIPGKDIKKYLLSIREQLAVGIVNGSSFEQLQKLVADLRSLNEEYESQNKELRKVQNELELKAEQLDAQRLKALESTKLKSQFLTNITHELKTPLNSIIGLSGLIINDPDLSERHSHRIEVIIRNGKKLLNLINNILEFSKAEAGRTIIKKETFALSNFLNEINSIVQPYAVEKGLNYICDAPEDYEILLNTDRAKLEQIIINLLNNSIKFTEEGIVKLTVNLTETKTIHFNVKDTGIGIDEKDREAIFEEFRQADGTISRQYDGTGLGLSICKKFVELLGGEFKLDSLVGRGSEFSVTIPDAVYKTEGQPEDKITSSDNGSKSVMVLDSSETTKKLIGDYLELNDYRIISPPSQSELFESIKTRNLDCIIINQDVYDGTGWNILHKLKSDSSNNSLVAIMIATQQESNLGYGFALFDYIGHSDYESQVEYVIGNVKQETRREKLHIISYSSDDQINTHLQEKHNVEHKKFDEQNLFEESKEIAGTDLIFIDLKDDKTIRLIDTLKHDRTTRGTKLVGILPKTFTEETKQSFIKSLETILQDRKHHILDILKIFRDRLKIAESELARTKLFLDEDKTEITKDEYVKSTVKVMVVDDDRDTLFTVGEIVRSADYKPIFAKNGVECILALKNEIPDLILLDIMMPKMDGFETLKEIRKHPEYNQIPVVAITAYAMLDDKDIVDKSGFDDIITKPIDSGVVFTKLQEVLKNKEEINE